MDQLVPESRICSQSDDHVGRYVPAFVYLQQTCQQIQALISSDRRELIILHRSKCCSLANAYAAGVEHVQCQILKALTASCPSTISAAAENLAPSLTAMHVTMVEGENFIKSCMKGSQWLKKALTLALSTEAIDVHFHDLLWSVSVVGAAVGRILEDCTDLDNQRVSQQLLQTMQMSDDIWRILLRDDTAHTMNQQMSEHEQKQSNGILDMHGLLKVAMSKTCADEDLGLVLSALEDVKAATVGPASSPSAEGDGVDSRFANFILDTLSNRPLDCISRDKLPPYLWVDRQEFKIQCLLGQGAYASVYRVEWLGEQFAMKDLSYSDSSMFDASTEVSVFDREVAIQASLRHPNVVQLICCTESSSDGYTSCGFVMELMQKNLGSLIAERVKKGCIPPFALPDAVDIMLQIAKGMEYLHSKHIMHRDLKSINVLVQTASGSHQKPAGAEGRIRAKIADFGMSKAKYMSSQYTTMHTGTTYWRAPEVFESKLHCEPLAEEDTTGLSHDLEAAHINASKYTKKADVYSFAMVCYEILSGKRPFQDLNVSASKLYKQLIQGVRPELPSSCPQVLQSYLGKCWHAEASRRPSFAEICRTLGYLKGILLTLADPMLSLTQSSDPLVEKLVQLMDTPAGANYISVNTDHQLEMCQQGLVEATLQERELGNKEGCFAEDGVNANIAQTLQTRDESLQKCMGLPKFFAKATQKSSVLRSLEKLRSCLLCKGESGLEKLGSCILCRHGPDKSQLGIVTSNLDGQQPADGGAKGPATSPSRDKDEYTDGGPKALATSTDLKTFTFQELHTATNGFHEMLGKGGYGTVFWGRFPNGQEVAVKRLLDIRADQFNVEGDVVPELRVVGLLRHSNLVPLRGWCWNGGGNELLLVYDLMPNGSLDEYLYNDQAGSKIALEWEKRYKIVCGLASALHYLHHECDDAHGLKVVHRDVKPSNVLLDGELNARLGDFGLAKLMEQRQVQAEQYAGSATSRGMMAGTIGYMDPQYVMTGELGTHSDVFSFGVVVLEVVCGRRVIDRRMPQDRKFLITWVNKFRPDELTRAADPRLEGVYDAKQMKKLLKIGILCTGHDSEMRPTMEIITKSLQASLVRNTFSRRGPI